MLTIRTAGQTLSRRGFLRLGALGMGGLSLADLLHLKARGAVPAPSAGKAIIMVYLDGGPSHVDMYDLKPDAPVEVRGEFQPIRTNVPGFDICEHFPLQARIADKLVLIRNMKFRKPDHEPDELYTGFPSRPFDPVQRPSIGSVVSKLRSEAGIRGLLPPYVALGDPRMVGRPAYLGRAHAAYEPGAKALNLGPSLDMPAERLTQRRTLLQHLDTLRRDLDDARGSMAGLDVFQTQALDMVTTTKARDAFDLTREPDKVRARYGAGSDFLLARRLVEAGVPVVTLTPYNHYPDERKTCNGNFNWDHHDHIFPCLRHALPQLDRSLYALITDLHERGLERDVCVVVWGEMGRTPRVGTQAGTVAGRDHWPQAGFALLAGGGLKTGQVIGATDRRGESPKGQPYTPENVLATLYHHLGIDAGEVTLADHSGRPIFLLDDPSRVAELI
jgi:hypothetical protein